MDVLVSEMPGSPNYDLAVKYGFKPVSAAEAAAQAQVVQILTQTTSRPCSMKTI